MGLASFLYPLILAGLVLHCHCHKRKIHVVYMGERLAGDVHLTSMHHSMISNVLGSALSAKESLVYSYGRSFNGFAAKLTDDEAAIFSEMEGVVSVIPNHKLNLHTTRSWSFMGLKEHDRHNPHEADVIVALLDTGIWPESESFNDKDMSPPPTKWKGKCQGANFTCNNKIIGATFYNSDNFYDPTDFKSPRDSIGHGTHTASTAAGRDVAGASYYGLAQGLARGGVPNARIAVYKVCWSSGCAVADILKAFDDAIADGVDIISVSLGSGLPFPYLEDPIAIGSFHAMKNGILTSNSAGNSGPYPVSVSNFAPWTLTVAASSIDRKFVAQVVLGSGQVLNGLSINNFDLNGTSYPLIWGGDAANYTVGANSEISKYCLRGAMNSYKVQRKIVLCEPIPDGFIQDGSAILEADGVGVITANLLFDDVAFNYPIPETQISTDEVAQVLEYIKSTDYPLATILVGETQKDSLAPVVVSFSSRGPSAFSPDILKPDITAPGVDILAAWSPVAPPSVYEGDTRSVEYNVISGTSMSCPHASGAAAYVKAAHPNWSPAAIKSALMTTAYIMDPKKNEDLEFAYGAGHINPVAAVDPGLVFDASETDYINFLCKQGYNTTTLRLVTGDNGTCSSTQPGRAWDLNYPSYSLYVEDGQQIYAVFNRTVTNVGTPNSTYKASFLMPTIISVIIEPSTLSFGEVGEKKSFKVKVTGPVIFQQPIMSGAILWEDGVHVVRSPLVVYNYLPGAPYNLDTSSRTLKKTMGSSVFGKNKVIGTTKFHP